MPFEMDLNSLLEMAKECGRLKEAEKHWAIERTELLKENARLREEVADYEEDAKECRKERLKDA